MELALHVYIRNIPDQYFGEEYDNTHEYVMSKLKEIAEGLEAQLYDVEVK